MARTGEPNSAIGMLKKDVLARAARERNQTLAEMFELAWESLSDSYRNEYVYKNELATRLIFKRHSPRTAGFQVELGVGRSIVDVAVANGTSTAYEIKTEFDSARRLASQTSDYLNVFDKVYVVTHPSHVARYEKELDSRVGLIVLAKQTPLTPYREARPNAQNVDPGVIFRCLRRSEYLPAVQEIFGKMPDLPNGHISTYCEHLFKTVSPLLAHTIFVNALRRRSTDQNTVDFVSQLPSSLRALGYATPLSGRQRATVLALLSQPLSQP
jgi:hypothetical protein